MDTQHYAADGWVAAIPAPGRRSDTVTFNLIVRPADIDTLAEDAPDTVVSCTSGDPRITRAPRTGIQSGDLLRVTGTLVLPQMPGEDAHLTVDALDVLGTTLFPVLSDIVLDRYANYVVVLEEERDQVPVCTAGGRLVGLADNPGAIATLVHTGQRVHGGDA
ncbi:hypothetical protein [Streptomyces sp. NPDC101249]|uniref:hypothetical protein n=1 Tax=Streptomyces sp. NPDC101249 TaxID=3366140 RepID=UPI00381DBCED